MNLTEAFKALDKLDEEAFSVTADGIEKLQDFTNLDDEIIDVYDVEAKSDKDVNDCHVGDGILDCSICHSKIFKPMAEIVIDEEQQLANVGEECPYCYSVDGYSVIGKVEALKEQNMNEAYSEDLQENSIIEYSLRLNMRDSSPTARMQGGDYSLENFDNLMYPMYQAPSISGKKLYSMLKELGRKYNVKVSPVEKHTTIYNAFTITLTGKAIDVYHLLVEGNVLSYRKTFEEFEALEKQNIRVVKKDKQLIKENQNLYKRL